MVLKVRLTIPKIILWAFTSYTVHALIRGKGLRVSSGFGSSKILTHKIDAHIEAHFLRKYKTPWHIVSDSYISLCEEGTIALLTFWLVDPNLIDQSELSPLVGGRDNLMSATMCHRVLYFCRRLYHGMVLGGRTRLEGSNRLTKLNFFKHIKRQHTLRPTFWGHWLYFAG